jgi:hypothetical protein
MSMGGKPKEPKDAKVLRQRQLIDLADLDEEENRRIKALFRARQGGRAFRAPTASRSATNTAGNASGGGGASLIPSSGFSPGRGATGGRTGASKY